MVVLHQRLVDESRQEVEYVNQIDRGYGSGRLSRRQVEPTGEDRQPPNEGTLLPAQKVVTPVESRAQCLLTGRSMMAELIAVPAA